MRPLTGGVRYGIRGRSGSLLDAPARRSFPVVGAVPLRLFAAELVSIRSRLTPGLTPYAPASFPGDFRCAPYCSSFHLMCHVYRHTCHSLERRMGVKPLFHRRYLPRPFCSPLLSDAHLP